MPQEAVRLSTRQRCFVTEADCRQLFSQRPLIRFVTTLEAGLRQPLEYFSQLHDTSILRPLIASPAIILPLAADGRASSVSLRPVGWLLISRQLSVDRLR